MSDASNVQWYLYHLRDPHDSFSFGHDGYVGITRDPGRRKVQHMSALFAGHHRNSRLQAAHDASSNGLQFWIVASGTREEVLARERLVVPKANHYLNIQRGGGPLRGMTEKDAITAAFRPADRHHEPRNVSAPPRGTAAKSTSATPSVDGVGLVSSEVAGVRTVFAGAGMTAAIVGTGLLSAGLGSAYVMSTTVLKDGVDLTENERKSRSDGRVGSYVGGAVGAVGTLAAIGASGSVVGLSGVGVAAGVGAIGAGVGGSVIAGTVIVTGLPVMAACGVGYGIYKVSKWLRSSE